VNSSHEAWRGQNRVADASRPSPGGVSSASITPSALAQSSAVPKARAGHRQEQKRPRQGRERRIRTERT
jgi:hypothetical protein